MWVKCGSCGRSFVVDYDLKDQDVYQCPLCGKESVYSLPKRVSLPGLPSDARRPAPSDAGKSAPHETNEQAENPAAEKKPELRIIRTVPDLPPENSDVRGLRRPKKGFSWQRWLIGLLVWVVIRYGLYRWKEHRDDVARQRQIFEAKLEVQRQRQEQEEEKIRKERAERDRLEAEKRKAEREAKERAREQQLKEQREKEDDDRVKRDATRAVFAKMREASCLFASDLGKNYARIQKDETIYFVRDDYLQSKSIYEIKCDNGKIASVQCLHETGTSQSLAEADFSSVTNTKHAVILRENGVTELWGTGINRREVKPSQDDALSPLDIELGDFAHVLREVGVAYPNCKYRISLKGKSKDDVIQLGIFTCGEVITPYQFAQMIDKIILERRAKKCGIKPPKLMKYTPTIVFYDGDIIRKGLKVTQVPRMYRTTKGAEQWMRLAEQAEMQARKAADVAAQNRNLMEEYENKIRQFKESAVTDQERQTLLSNYMILIERSLTKQK